MDNCKSWVEISEKALLHNVKAIRKRLGSKVGLLAVVKSNAYGHGITEITQILKDKVDWFGVDNIDEALAIRSLGIITPILVLGYVPIQSFKEAAQKNISIAFYNGDVFSKLAYVPLPCPIKIHLKIETGMHRQGISKDKLYEFIEKIKRYSGKLQLEGAYTHFSDTDNIDFMDYQFKGFIESVNILEKVIDKKLIKHCSASAGIFTDKKYYLDLVRSGIGLYGYWSSDEIEKRARKVELNPVLTWKSTVAQIKFVEKGGFVGYARAWIAKKKTKIAIIPTGYFDGFDRGSSDNGRVLIRGKYAPIVGRVTMNMFMVDVSRIRDIKVGDEIVIIGKQNGAIITADELAERIGTISHEILSRISPLLPRKVV